MVHGVTKSWTERLTPHHHRANLVSYLWTKPKAFDNVICSSLSQKLAELRRVHLHGLHCLQIVTELRGARLHGPILSEADWTERSMSAWPSLSPDGDWTERSMSAWAHIVEADRTERNMSAWAPLSQKLTELRGTCLHLRPHCVLKLIELRGECLHGPHCFQKLNELGEAFLRGPTVSEDDWTEGSLSALFPQSPEPDWAERSMCSWPPLSQKLTDWKKPVCMPATISTSWTEQSMFAWPPLSQNVTELIEAYLQGPPCLQKLTELRIGCLHGPHRIQRQSELGRASLHGLTLSWRWLNWEQHVCMDPLSQKLTELRGICLYGPHYLRNWLTEWSMSALPPLSPEGDWIERSISAWPLLSQKLIELKGACLYGPHCLQLYHHHGNWLRLKGQKGTSLSLILTDDLPPFWMTSPWPWMKYRLERICQNVFLLVFEPHQCWQSWIFIWRKCLELVLWDFISMSMSRLLGGNEPVFLISPDGVFLLHLGGSVLSKIIITCLFPYNPPPETYWLSYPNTLVNYYMFSWLILYFFDKETFSSTFSITYQFSIITTNLWLFTNA